MFFAACFEEVEQPGRGVVVVVDVEVFVADHVGDEEGLDFGEGAVLRTTWRRGGGCRRGSLCRCWPPFCDGLFAVVEDEPDGVALGRMGAEVVADFDEEGGGAGSVVGSDEVDVAQGVVGLVVAGEDDDAVFLSGVALCRGT